MWLKIGVASGLVMVALSLLRLARRRPRIIMRSAEGGYTERHLPIAEGSAYALTARDRDVTALPAGDTDENGVNSPNASRIEKLDEAMAVMILASVADKKAAKILGFVDVDKSVRLSRSLKVKD